MSEYTYKELPRPATMNGCPVIHYFAPCFSLEQVHAYDELLLTCMNLNEFIRPVTFIERERDFRAHQADFVLLQRKAGPTHRSYGRF